MNLETMVALSHGVSLVVSTHREGENAFHCRVIEVNTSEKESLAYRVVSDGFEAMTCMEAQTDAYNYAMRVYPDFAERMKKPPYLIGGGPMRNF